MGSAPSAAERRVRATRWDFYEFDCYLRVVSSPLRSIKNRGKHRRGPPHPNTLSAILAPMKNAKAALIRSGQPSSTLKYRRKKHSVAGQIGVQKTARTNRWLAATGHT